MTPKQCRMARAGLGWGVRELAAAAMVSTNTIARLERGEQLHARTIAAIRRALEDGGATFLDATALGPGVRVRESPGSTS